MGARGKQGLEDRNWEQEFLELPRDLHKVWDTVKHMWETLKLQYMLYSYTM